LLADKLLAAELQCVAALQLFFGHSHSSYLSIFYVTLRLKPGWAEVLSLSRTDKEISTL
jgi:hypothetical protein